MCSISRVWGQKEFNVVAKRIAECCQYTNWETNTGHGNQSCGITKIQSSNCGAGLKLKLSGHAHHEIAADYDHTNQKGKDMAALALMGIDLLKGMS